MTAALQTDGAVLDECFFYDLFVFCENIIIYVKIFDIFHIVYKFILRVFGKYGIINQPYSYLTREVLMKTTIKIPAVILALLMLLPTLLSPLTLLASGGASEGLLFSASFEEGEKTPFVSKADGTYYAGLEAVSLSADIKGDFTEEILLNSVQGSNDFKTEEGKTKLFDGSPATKFLTQGTPTSGNPVFVSFRFSEPKTVGVYALTSANDEEERDPREWTLYGSTDGETYQKIDYRYAQSFSSRGLTKYYTVDDPAPYTYYKFEITQNRGGNMTQLADLFLGTGEGEGKRQGDSPLSSEVTAGPLTGYVSTGAFAGEKTLTVYGKHATNEESYARNLLYSGLNIKVDDNTRLSYLHFPEIRYGYDFEYSAMYMMIDLKFTDGSYLSGLSALDQNGFAMTPQAKGDSEALYTGQWNYVETCLGEVAKGKTIDSVYVYYHRDSVVDKKQFIAHFDDLVIENRKEAEYSHLSDYVNTLRGTNSNSGAFSRGLTTPFITMPNGFNFFTPVTNSGKNTHYDYFDDAICHFSVSHVPSTWTGDYGTWQFMANTSLKTDSLTSIGAANLNTANLGAGFSHDNETAKAHYYAVTFDEGSKASGVKVEMTPTVHGVAVRFTFPEDAENVNIIFDCVRAGGLVTIKDDGTFTARSDHTDRGSNKLQIFGKFSTAPASFKNIGKNGIAVFPKGTAEVTMFFATSFISQAQAKRNYELEIGANDTFDSIFERAQKAWDDICGMVEVEGASYTEKVTLYSNLYRMYSYPNLYSENRGTNEEPDWVYASPYHAGRLTEGKLYVNNGFWDTYRTAWAAYALLTPNFDGELLDGIVQHYKDNGWIPRWIAPGGTSSMLGTSSDIIFADAYIKGIEFDYEKAFESMLKNAATVSSNVDNGGRHQNNTAPFTGYVTNDIQYGFSWTMEDYISDYCIGVMAQALGYTDEAEYYFNRARFYVNTFNPSCRFFMGKNASGAWTNSSYDGVGWWGDYSETNGWTMAFAPVYDGEGLKYLYSGQKQFLRKLEDYFNDSLSAMKKVADGGIHEMVEAREVRMGQYSHSNQPAHAVPYMFIYADRPDRTQEITREILSRLYVGSEIGQGYCGDEDNGEMSAWYLLSAIGLYPQNMGSGEYVITSPLFDKVTVHMDNGKDLVIIANNNSKDNVYIQSLTVNGKAHNEAFISHKTVSEGATLVFDMGAEPSDWGKGKYPTSLTTGAKADPAEDLVTKSFKYNQSALPETLTNGVYSETVSKADLEKLFDNNSNTAATLESGTVITVSSNKASRLLLYTVTSASAKNRAPKGILVEGSVDGKTWVKLSEVSELKYEWAKYVRGFAIPEESFANYKAYRMTVTSTSDIQISEIEFLTLSSDGDAGESSTKPSLPFAEKSDVKDPDNGKVDPDVTTSAPTTDITPSTDDPGNGSGSGNAGSMGLVIGISAAAVVAIGGGAVFFLVFKKAKRG